MQKVTLDTEQITASTIIDRNGAAQIIIQWLNPEVAASVSINGVTYTSASTNFVLFGYVEPVNAGEYVDTSINLKLTGTAKVVVTRKYYEK